MKRAKQEKTLSFPVIFNPAPEGGFDVSFPDFPGCVTFGQNFEEAKEMAREVLSLWIEQLQADKMEIPVRTAHPIVDELHLVIA